MACQGGADIIGNGMTESFMMRRNIWRFRYFLHGRYEKKNEE